MPETEDDLLLPEWMDWDGRCLVIESRRIPAMLDSVVRIPKDDPVLGEPPHAPECFMGSPNFLVWFENGAGLDIDIGFLNKAEPPHIQVKVELAVQITGDMPGDPGVSYSYTYTPARIEDGEIVPLDWQSQDVWWCEEVEGPELLRYIDTWSKLTVRGLERGRS